MSTAVVAPSLKLRGRPRCRRQAAESPNQSELGSDAVNGETEPHLQRKRETTLGFALHLIEWIARREKVCVQVGVAGRLRIEITALVCDFERATHQIAATPDMSRPRNHHAPKVEKNPGLEALQPSLFDQIIAELPESKSGLVVAEAWPCDVAKHCIGHARCVTVAILEAKVDCPAAD